MELNYQEMIERRNKKNLFAAHIGLKITEMTEGYAVTRLKIQPEFRNPVGSIHGGVLFSAADSACGAAAHSYGRAVTTVDSHFHYLNAGLADSTEIKATAHMVKAGKKLNVIDCDVEDQNGKLLCHGTFTYYVLENMEW